MPGIFHPFVSSFIFNLILGIRKLKLGEAMFLGQGCPVNKSISQYFRLGGLILEPSLLQNNVSVVKDAFSEVRLPDYLAAMRLWS